ncbi:glycosyltransferase family 2 protein [Aeromonas veronii]|uniref:glycosyltransferase family 2 protein n=1 Tax=Aeromonas veronii TaxID=654 RepID=UPI002444461D|nr:glycosyltransferase family 2 protein [Aeromonas veronii]
MMLLSICIPTKNRPVLLEKTLQSFFDEPVDKALYEVVISDNSDDDANLNVVNKFKSMGLQCVYYRNPEQGFYNSIKALVLGNGDFLKLNNDYTKFKSGSLQKMIDLVSANIERKPQMFFTDGNVKSKKINYFSDFDTFLGETSYWNTWSTGFSIWRSDLDLLDTSRAALDENFPHVSLLFANKNKSDYCVDDRIHFINQPVSSKGGYNIFKLFCVDYVDMLRELIDGGSLTEKTYKKILRNLRDKFIPQWLQASVYTKNGLTFNNDDYISNIKLNFSGKDFLIIKIRAYVYVIIWHVKQLVKKCFAMCIKKTH